MTAIKKKSTILIIITVLLLFSLSSGGLYTIYLTSTVESDGEIINKLGTVRGSMQRVVKLEINHQERDDIIGVIDTIIYEFKSGEIKVYDKHGEIKGALNELEKTWSQLKELINRYRKEASYSNKELLIEKSEEAWQKADNTVLISQIVSERKIDQYTRSSIIFFINLSITIIIILLIKRYVKDTLEYRVRHDGLTKVYNRDYFREFLHKEIIRSERHKRDLSMIMIDIDHFKKVNDTYGHNHGDYVLKELSKVILNNIRGYDVFARIGGEEFGVIAPETDSSKAKELAEKLRKVIENHSFKSIAKLTISLGITQFMRGDSSMEVLERADSALYKAKEKGRNRSELEI